MSARLTSRLRQGIGWDPRRRPAVAEASSRPSRLGWSCHGCSAAGEQATHFSKNSMMVLPVERLLEKLAAEIASVSPRDPPLVALGALVHGV